MSETSTLVLEIDKPYFTIRLYENRLNIDLKKTIKNEIVEACENKPVLRETIGRLFGMFIPLHIRLGEVNSTRMDYTENMEYTGNVHIDRLHHRDIVIPLPQKEALQFVQTLNQLIQKAKKGA